MQTIGRVPKLYHLYPCRACRGKICGPRRMIGNTPSGNGQWMLAMGNTSDSMHEMQEPPQYTNSFLHQIAMIDLVAGST